MATAEPARSLNTPMSAAVSAVVPLSVSRTAFGEYRWMRSSISRSSARSDQPLLVATPPTPAKTAETDSGERTGTWYRKTLTEVLLCETTRSREKADQPRTESIRDGQRQTQPKLTT